MADFESLLSMNADEVERPKPRPAGHYIALITGHEFGESSKKKTPYVRYAVKLMEALSDVDEEMLEEAGGFEDAKMSVDFYVTENSLFRLKEFLADHVGLEMDNRPLKEGIPEAVNNQVGVVVEHEISTQSPEDVFARIRRTFNPDDAPDLD